MGDPVRFAGRELVSPPTESQPTRGVILDQLERILVSPLFRHSKRCGPLLRFAVTETLEGRGDQLKERAIGVSVFGRNPNYDTNEDPIVRTSAVEVRKRIAQYYHESGHEAELRIDLTSGSYVPSFRVPAEPVSRVPLSPAEPSAETASLERMAISLPRESRHWRRQKWTLAGIAVTVAAITAAAIGVATLRFASSRDPLTAFWRPLMDAESVTLVMGNTGEMLPPAPGFHGPLREPTFYDTIQADKVGFVDGMTVARIAAVFSSKGKKFEVRRGGSVTLQDLRKAPAVLVGALNNPWTSLLEQHLRFRFVYDPARRATDLEDQQNPARTLWKTERDMPYAELKEDRAIISRFVDSRTEQTVVLVAGFGRDGTAAGGEFITSPKYLQLLAARAPAGWEKKNLQVVIATDLINGHSGPPRVIAMHFW